MANLQEYIDKDLIPTNPEVIKAIESGQVDVETVAEKYKGLKERQAALESEPEPELEPELEPEPEPEPFGQPLEKPASVEAKPFGAVLSQQDKILKDAMDAGEIPANAEVLDSIRNGSVTMDHVREAYKALKLKTGEPATINKEGLINKPEDLYSAAMDKVKADKPIYKGPDGLTGSIADNFVKIVKNDYEKASYIADQYTEGLTFDILGVPKFAGAPEQAPDTISWIMGGAAKLVGYGISGVLGGGLLAKAPIVGPALAKLGGAAKGATEAVTAAKAAGQAVGTGAKAAAHALQVASISAEGAALGFGVGAAKGAIEGGDVGDILADGMLTAAEFAVGGALLYPVGVGIGKGMEKVGRVKFGIRAKALAGQAEELVKQEPQYYIDKLRAMDQNDPGVQEALRYANAALKVKATDVSIGVFPITEKLKSPEAIEAVYKGRREDLENIVKGAFIGKDAELAAIYDAEPTVKAMVDTGQYAKAMMVGQTFFREQLKKNKVVSDWLGSAFVQDSKFVYDVLADRTLGKLDAVANPNTARNLITNYLSDLEKGVATKKDLKGLRDIVAGKDKQARKQFGSFFQNKEKFLDTRLTADEADAVIGKILNGHLEVLAGKEKLPGFGFVGEQEKLMYHGTPNKIESFSKKYQGNWERNLYGDGFYVTDNKGVAVGYSKKGGKEGNVYSFKKNKDVKLFDLDKPLTKEERKIFEPIFEYSYEDGLVGNTLAKAYDETRSTIGNTEISGLIAEEMRPILERMGYSGYKHVGGKISGKIKHNVEIYWNPSKDIMFSDEVIRKPLQSAVSTKSPFGSIAKISEAADEQGMLKAAIWANKQLQLDMAGAYGRGVNSINDALIISNPKAGIGLRDEVRIRTTAIQVNNDLNRVRELQLQLKEKGLQQVARKDVAEALKAGTPLDEATMMSHEILTLKGGLSEKYKIINKTKESLDSLTPEVRAEVTRVANEVYIPGKKDLGLGRKQTTELLMRFGYKDSPVYLKASDELVDMIGALNHTGVDMTDAFTRKLNLPFIANVENYRRIAQREFGYNNPMDTYLRGIKDADIAADKYKSVIMEKLRPIGIKKGTKESALLFDHVDGKLEQGSDAFNTLPADLQKKLIEGKETVKGIYKTTLKDINDVMKLHNLPEVAERQDYITHYIETMELYPDLVKQLENIKDPEALKSLNIFFSHRKGDPSKTFMSWELPRTGAEHTKDAIGAIEKYIKPAAERIFYTPLVRGLDTAKVFATGKNTIAFFDHIKNNVLLRTPNEWTKAGSPGLNKFLEVFQKRLAKGALFGNINTVIQQVASTPLSLLIGGREALVATVNRFSKDSVKLMGMSQNLHLRSPTEWADMDARLFKGLLESANQIPGSQTVRAGYNYWQRFTEWGLKTFDKEAASHAFRTGIAKGRKAGITDEKSLVALGDAYADMLQGSFAKVDRPFIMDTPFARAFFQFQSFAMNLGATIMTDLPLMAKQEGVGKTIKSLLRTAAGASIVNSIAEENGMPPPFSLGTFLPGGSTFRFGAPGAFQAIGSTVKFAMGAESGKQFGKEMVKLGTTLAVPGGGQIYKTTEALTTRARKGERVKGALFGSGTQRFKREEKRNEKRSWEYKAKKKIKRTFGL